MQDVRRFSYVVRVSVRCFGSRMKLRLFAVCRGVARRGFGRRQTRCHLGVGLRGLRAGGRGGEPHGREVTGRHGGLAENGKSVRSRTHGARCAPDPSQRDSAACSPWESGGPQPRVCALVCADPPTDSQAKHGRSDGALGKRSSGTGQRSGPEPGSHSESCRRGPRHAGPLPWLQATGRWTGADAQGGGGDGASLMEEKGGHRRSPALGRRSQIIGRWGRVPCEGDSCAAFPSFLQLLQLIAKSQLTSLSGVAQKNYFNVLGKIVQKGKRATDVSHRLNFTERSKGCKGPAAGRPAGRRDARAPGGVCGVRARVCRRARTREGECAGHRSLCRRMFP